MLADRSRRGKKTAGEHPQVLLVDLFHRSEDRMRVFCIDMNIGQG